MICGNSATLLSSSQETERNTDSLTGFIKGNVFLRTTFFLIISEDTICVVHCNNCDGTVNQAMLDEKKMIKM